MKLEGQESDSMSNVISFPRQVAEAARPVRPSGAKTLFIHVRQTTFIAHLAAPHKLAPTAGRVGKK